MKLNCNYILAYDLDGIDEKPIKLPSTAKALADFVVQTEGKSYRFEDSYEDEVIIEKRGNTLRWGREYKKFVEKGLFPEMARLLRNQNCVQEVEISINVDLASEENQQQIEM